MDPQKTLQEAYKAMNEKIKAVSKSVLESNPYVGTELERRILVAKEMKRMIELEIYQMEKMQLEEKIKEYTQ